MKLEQNYRSTGTILDAANAVIANNIEQKQKNLWTDAGRGEPVVVAELDDEHAEARYVAGEIERLVSDEDYGRDDIAVFYRMNAQSRVLEDTLVRYEVPYQVIGGTKFYERAEVKDAIAYLSLLANPADAISFTRVINSPRRGIGRQTESRILSHVNTTGEDVWDVMSRPESVPGLGAAAIKAVSRFAAVMAGLRERAEGDSVAELLESVLHDTGYFDSLEAERTLEAEGRMENLQELVGVAGEFDVNRKVEGEEREDTPLEEFLAQIRLFTEQDGIRDSESLITLMSLHNAKGLEYDAAFIIGCEEGVFPHARSVEEGNLEEERRLAYVGVTRAKQRLYMTCARRRSLHGSSGWNLPSRFLREVPDELVDHKAMAVQTGWQGERAGGSRRDTVLGFGGAGEFRAPQRIQPQTPEVEFRIGDDVVHASFGEGVVTSVEPGSRRGRPLRLRGRRAQADGRLRAAQEGLVSAPQIIDGKAVAARGPSRGRARTSRRSSPRTTPRPGLATVLVGDDPASHVYVGNKIKACEEAGIRSIHHGLGADVSQAEPARSGRRAQRRRRRSTGSSSRCRCRTRSTRTPSSRRSIRPRTSTA